MLFFDWVLNNVEKYKFVIQVGSDGFKGQRLFFVFVCLIGLFFVCCFCLDCLESYGVSGVSDCFLFK